MRLKINGFENEFEFDDEHINILTVKEIKCFTHIIEIINEKILGVKNNEIFLLNDEDEEIKFSNCFMIFDLFNIDYNSKKILNKLYDIIANRVENRQDLEMQNLMLKLRNKVIEEVNELPFEFTMKDELEIADMLKLYSLKIDSNNYENVLERVEFLIDLIATLQVADLIIIPNLKIYLSDEELVELYKYSLYNNVRLLLIERENKKKLKYEKEMIIDENYYDMIV